MAKINVLDKAVAELIAAGEVVERPASIVKELVENAIDAGASAITVEIAGGGIRMIRVADDGCGIEAEDIPNAFLRHATSKVASAADLDGILTLGFRGEALASIAAMAKVELSTKTEDAAEGSVYRIEGGEPLELDVTGRPRGTTITVRDVFYNTPARMKFLKKDVGEGNAVAQVIDKCALSHPEVAFRFIRDGQVRLSTSGNGSLAAVVRSVYGPELAGELAEVDYLLDGAIHVTGVIGRPSASRPSRAFQTFFINHRYVRTRTCTAALEEAFKNKLMTGRFPVCVLNLDVTAQTVDVNVHPAKIEVRFADERPIYNAVYFGVKSALASLETPVTAAPAPAQRGTVEINPLTLQLPRDEYRQERLSVQEFRDRFVKRQTEEPPRRDFARPSALRSPSLDIYVDEEPAGPVRQPDSPGFAQKNRPVSDSMEGEDEFSQRPLPSPPPVKGREPESGLPAQEALPIAPEEPPVPFRLVGELFATYILLEREGELILVDKHAAHERMLYEYLVQNLAYGNRQVLLSPVTVALSKDEYNAVLERPDAFRDLGFGVEDFGGGMLLVREVPIELGEDDIPGIVGEIAARLLRGHRNLTPEALDRLYYSIACKGAVRAGDKNSPEELKELIRKLERNPQITHCPHGRPVSVRVSRREIEKMFGRIV